MPAQFKGFGTAYLGEKDLEPNGVHTATEWVTLAYIPIVPLRSFRIVRDPSGDGRGTFTQITYYGIVERLPLDFLQIASTYSFILFSFLWCAAAGYFVFVVEHLLQRPPTIAIALTLSLIVALSVPALVVWFVRREAFRSRHRVS